MNRAHQHTVWEYASLQVDWRYKDGKYEYTAAAWSDGDALFEETYDNMYWTAPLAKMGRLGWELVGLNPQNVLAEGFLEGYDQQLISTPVRMVFFFKRPQL